MKTCESYIPVGDGCIFTKIWSVDLPMADNPAPILLFHESLGCVEFWRGFPEKLATATGRPVIAYDRLGFGRADPHPGKLDMDFVAREAEKVVPLLKDRLGFSRFVACGHSVGSGMAVETAAKFSEDCAALVTMGAHAFVEDLTLAGIRRAREKFARPETRARLAKYHGDKTEWVVNAWIETWLSPAFSDWTLESALTRVRCPVLAIHGEIDEYGSSEHARRLAQGRGRATILRGVGHFPHRDSESNVLDLIRTFLGVKAKI